MACCGNTPASGSAIARLIPNPGAVRLCSPMKIRRLPTFRFHPICTLLLGGIFAGTGGRSLRAELPSIASGETVVFSDDFVDNRNAWSGVIATTLSAPGAITQARIFDSVWSPSEPGSESIKSSVESVHTLAKPIDLTNGPVAVYFRARVDVPRGGDGNRFAISLHEAKKSSFASLSIRPGVNCFVDYRNDTGKATSSRLGGVRFTEGVFQQFKLVVSAAWNVDGFIGRIEAFAYDDQTRTYASLGAADESVMFKTGQLEQLGIIARNGSTGFAYIDSIAVTQTRR